MRELATQKLARAYKLDEIAASVATMQSASSLEDVAALVLQRNPRDADAEYVHFFHEKIPSRMLAKCTSLAPLDRVIAERPTEGAPLRTRAVTRVFKDDFHGAAADLTAALNLGKRMAALHDDQGADVEKGVVVVRGAGRKLQPTMEDEEMPSSLEAQLLFHRACTYLSVAVGHVEVVLSSPAEDAASDTARKAVRTYAKRALRDYSRFLGFFEYTPGNGEIWSIANMFGPTPPAMLPVAEAESLTYHPLLTDAMYSLLLAHLLLATPLKELVRHAATVNRLARIADGYPVFLAARSPARADWLEVIRRTGLELGIRDGEGEGPGQAEYPVSTERAGTVGRWFKEGRGGVVPGTAKKRRRKPEAAAAGSAAAAGKQPE